MPGKPSMPSHLPLVPARAPAAHVQAAVAGMAQAKMPERSLPATQSSSAVSNLVQTPHAAARPVAPHVQSALARMAQAKTAQRTNGVFRGTIQRAHVSSAAAVAAASGGQSDSEDDEVVGILGGGHALRTLADLKGLLKDTYGVEILENAIVPCTAQEINHLYGFGLTLASGRAPRGTIYENEYKGKFASGASKAIAKLMFSKTAAWDFSTVSASGQPVLGYDATTWDKMGTIL